jgi:tRNA(Arg) A34 adenosine deaminase TadA
MSGASERDEHFLRLSFAVARRSLTQGNHPFGCIVVDADGKVLIEWVGIGRVVYGLSEHRLRGITGDHPENPTLDLPCREVFASGQRPTEVVGPLLEDEAEALHDGVWK